MENINWKSKFRVATRYLVSFEQNVLLTWNKNLQTPVAISRHIDFEGAAKKAIICVFTGKTGLQFEFVSSYAMYCHMTTCSIQNQKVQIEEISYYNTYLNFIFFNKFAQGDKVVTSTDEQKLLKLLVREDLNERKKNFLPNVLEQTLGVSKKAR